MAAIQWLATFIKALIKKLLNKIDPKVLGIGLLVLAFVLFGDVLLPLLLQGLHLLVEVVEVTLEHFLEKAFGLTARQAQFVLAYSALVLGLALTGYLGVKAYRAAIAACCWLEAMCRYSWESLTRLWQEQAWKILGAGLCALTVALFFFT